LQTTLTMTNNSKDMIFDDNFYIGPRA